MHTGCKSLNLYLLLGHCYTNYLKSNIFQILDGETEILLPGDGKMGVNSSKILRGRGPSRMMRTATGSSHGNLIVHFRLALPKGLSPEQTRLIERFDKLEKDPAFSEEEERWGKSNSSEEGAKSSC